MNNFVIDTPDNFWQIRWLDKYMEGHKGFIAGGCFKNILSGEKVKDIDIFFESESDFQEAVDLFNDEKHQKEGWKFKYRNEKACAFQKEGEKVWVEFIESEFGKPEEILRSNGGNEPRDMAGGSGASPRRAMDASRRGTSVFLWIDRG